MPTNGVPSTAPSSLANKNATDRSRNLTIDPIQRNARTPGNTNSNSKAGPDGKPVSTQEAKNERYAESLPACFRRRQRGRTPTPTQRLVPATPLASPAAQATPQYLPHQSRQDWMNRMKERLNYWILLAQLNPIPGRYWRRCALVLIALFLFQRRRAKAPRQRNSRKINKRQRPPSMPQPASHPVFAIRPAGGQPSSLEASCSGQAVVGRRGQPERRSPGSGTLRSIAAGRIPRRQQSRSSRRKTESY